MNKPITNFQSDAQFQETAKWWQHKLGLDDWLIKYELVDKKIVTNNSAIEYGETMPNYILKYAKIKIANNYGCTELTIVHELLHLLVPFSATDIEYACTPNDDNYLQNIFKDGINHRALESLAKSLIMVKYPEIDRDYFMIDLNVFIEEIEKDPE